MPFFLGIDGGGQRLVVLLATRNRNWAREVPQAAKSSVSEKLAHEMLWLVRLMKPVFRQEFRLVKLFEVVPELQARPGMKLLE